MFNPQADAGGVNPHGAAGTPMYMPLMMNPGNMQNAMQNQALQYLSGKNI